MVRAEAQCGTGLYADHKKLLDTDLAKIRRGLRLTEEFSELTDLRYGQREMLLHRPGETLTLVLQGEPIVQARGEIKDLGAQICLVSREKISGICDKRVKQAIEVCRRLEAKYLNLGFPAQGEDSRDDGDADGLRRDPHSQPAVGHLELP